MSKFTRRDFGKLGVYSGVASLAANLPASGGAASGSVLVSSSGLKSPPVRPWVEPLYIPPVVTPTTLSPAFQPNEPARDWWPPYVHQRYAEFPAKKFYQLDVQNTNWSFHRDLPPVPLFFYNSGLPA